MKHNTTRWALGGAHVLPTKVFRRLTASVNKTIVKPRVAACSGQYVYVGFSRRKIPRTSAYTYKVLTTAQPSYLHNLISLQPPRSTRSSYVVTLSRPPPSLPWKSQIAHLDMHHLVFGINFQIHSVSLTIPVSIHLLIHLSTHLCHHPHSRHPSPLHSFTPGSKSTFSTSHFHRRFLLPTGLLYDNGTGPDLLYSSFYF